MKIPRIFLHITILLTCLLTSTCSPKTTSSIAEKSRINQQVDLHPKLQFFRQDHKLLRLYFSLPTENLLFARRSENQPLQAELRVTVSGIDSKAELKHWEITRDYRLSKKHSDFFWIDHLDLSSKSDYRGEAIVTIQDLVRGAEFTAYTRISEARISSQKFLTIDASSKAPLLKEYYHTTDSLIIHYGKSDATELYVNIYDYPENAAPAPFVEPWKLHLPKFQKQLQILVRDQKCKLPHTLKPKIFEIRADSESDDYGLILPFFKPGFPKIKDGEDMIYPLRYITTDEEFDKLKASNNYRKSAEEFWLKRCKSKDKARDILGEYYRRVLYANENFTSFVPGWKSDRGMIYTIFGNPDNITKRPGQEIWVYGREINTVRLSFTFVQRENMFSFNHYELLRNGGYKAIWDLATNSWRNGRIFNY
ncbi:GWxTD domain-containing protein [Luteibaculum oceani]|uniref:GWxTD domain-containing protein n=1 Tax=Luteibaculum oceani TaxID=1294296 RepID=A0A5C6UYK6_9FLAO|nr:GWxTD domain-containing protein [Luteibaculum oceani]TXC78377.1 GWxTD domain-containing protein [Luteibaculum oceani]